MKQILIIEDDPAILKGLTISLEAENYKVRSQSDGEKGYQFAKTENVDLIILDIMLPGKMDWTFVATCEKIESTLRY